MNVTNQFFVWFYYGLGGLGGWFIFLLLALAAVIWLLYDSGSRRLPATGWKIAVILISLLILPAILYRFTVDPLDPNSITEPLFPFSEAIFYLGLLAGILPPVLAIGYYVTYQGLKGCPFGHPPYEARFGQCPECRRINTPPPPPIIEQPRYPQRDFTPSAPPPPPPKPKAQAWLASSSGHTYQLNLGETTIGRSSTNDIQLAGDNTVSRQHIKILESNGHFKIVDLVAKGTTRINGHIVRESILLEPDDDIQLGDNIHLRFVTTRR